MINYIIGILAIVIVFGVIYSSIKKQKSGSTGCGCSCKECSSSKECNLTIKK